MSRISVELWANVPTSFTVHLDSDDARAAGVHMENDEDVDLWAEEQAIKKMRAGDVDAEGWDWRDVEHFGVNTIEGSLLDWADLTDEERARVPEADRP